MADTIATRLVDVIVELLHFFMESLPVLKFLVFLACLAYATAYIRENNRAVAQMTQELRLLRLRACAESGMKDSMMAYRCSEFLNIMEVK